MSQETQSLNLMQKLAKIRKIADFAVRNKSGFNYSYADVSQILAKVKSGMEKYGVSLLPMITPGTSEVSQVIFTNTKTDKAGKPYDQTTTEMLYKADMVFRWTDDASGDSLDIPWEVTGSQSDPSQAFGSGLTYCTRYFLTNYFQIPQVAAKDVDEYRSQQKEAESAEDKAIAAEIIASFDSKLRQYLADFPDKAEVVKQFITRFAKNGNYQIIKDPALAAKLLEDFNDHFLKERSDT